MTYERTRLTADTTIYASPSGSGSQDGSSASNAFAGVQAAWNALQRDYDLNGWTATIQLTDGGYSAGLQAYGPMLGQMKPGGSPVIIKGNSSDAASVYFNTPGVNTFSFDGGAVATIVLLTGSASGASIFYATNGAMIEYGSCRFGSANAQVYADVSGRTICTGSCDIVQGANFHIVANSGQAGIVPGVNLTFGSGLSFAGQFVYTRDGGVARIPIPGVTFTGSFSGQKGYSSILGILDCSGGANSIPGTIDCGANYGGQVY